MRSVSKPFCNIIRTMFCKSTDCHLLYIFFSSLNNTPQTQFQPPPPSTQTYSQDTSPITLPNYFTADQVRKIGLTPRCKVQVTLVSWLEADKNKLRLFMYERASAQILSVKMMELQPWRSSYRLGEFPPVVGCRRPQDFAIDSCPCNQSGDDGDWLNW